MVATLSIHLGCRSNLYGEWIILNQEDKNILSHLFPVVIRLLFSTVLISSHQIYRSNSICSRGAHIWENILLHKNNECLHFEPMKEFLWFRIMRSRSCADKMTTAVPLNIVDYIVGIWNMNPKVINLLFSVLLISGPVYRLKFTICW